MGKTRRMHFGKTKWIQFYKRKATVWRPGDIRLENNMKIYVK
jgi:hypothetical protein